jgi:hypothetical protein
MFVGASLHMDRQQTRDNSKKAQAAGFDVGVPDIYPPEE